MGGSLFGGSFKKGVARLPGGLFEVVTGFEHVIEHPGTSNHALEAEPRGEICNPFGVFTARFSETMIQMRDADACVELVMSLELFDTEEQGSRIGAAGNGDDDCLARHRELELAPLGKQHARKLIESHGHGFYAET